MNRRTARLIARGNLARNEGRWEEAKSKYMSALEETPDLAHIWIQLGHARKQLGDDEGAAEAYRSALSCPSINEGARADASHELRELGRDVPRPAKRGEMSAAANSIDLTVVVNFYNMQREAARTLTSLSRSYQRGIDDLAYEVICVDNGSNPPMDHAWVESFGPEFRLYRPTDPHPSPVFALNDAVLQARGRHLAMMIDGAHILSPGVFFEAMKAVRSEPGAMAALRLWFVGGDQRWLSQVGHTREQEDILFSRINWPQSGYRLFDISSPMFETPDHWLEGLSETNCLFISRDAFDALGGYDEAFSIPGGGLANLDLFVRAARSPGATMIALIGEASFHQFHGGTTTNVSDADKDVLVRQYMTQYEQIRGRPFAHVEAHEMQFRGRLQGHEAQIFGRQRPAFPLQLGLTDRIRPATPWLQFDEGAVRYLQGVYAETGAHQRTRWAGKSVGIAPTDLVEIQEMLAIARPETLILKDVSQGLAHFIHSILPALGLESLRMISVGDTDPGIPGVARVISDRNDLAVLDRIEDLMDAPERSCVLFQPLVTDTLPVDELQAYSRFVTPTGYMVVLDTGLGQPVLGYSSFFLNEAIRHFLNANPGFVVDTGLNAHLVTTCPSGFLYRLPNVHFDCAGHAELDVIEE